jgi:hypothetical protein
MSLPTHHDQETKGEGEMKVRRIFFAVALVAGLLIASQGITAAQEKPGFNPSAGLKDNLASNIGKRVSLMISAGESIEGTIEKVGDHFVLMSRLSGKDFYDALVRIDEVKAVVFRAR